MNTPLSPAAVCGALLAALDASSGRSRRRKRDQTPDAIGLAVKRQLLEQAVHDDPGPAAFEAWLLRYAQEQPRAWAMALAVRDEWRLAAASSDFASWLQGGAPSADTESGDRRGGT